MKKNNLMKFILLFLLFIISTISVISYNDFEVMSQSGRINITTLGHGSVYTNILSRNNLIYYIPNHDNKVNVYYETNFTLKTSYNLTQSLYYGYPTVTGILYNDLTSKLYILNTNWIASVNSGFQYTGTYKNLSSTNKTFISFAFDSRLNKYYLLTSDNMIYTYNNNFNFLSSINLTLQNITLATNTSANSIIVKGDNIIITTPYVATSGSGACSNVAVMNYFTVLDKSFNLISLNNNSPSNTQGCINEISYNNVLGYYIGINNGYYNSNGVDSSIILFRIYSYASPDLISYAGQPDYDFQLYDFIYNGSTTDTAEYLNTPIATDGFKGNGENTKITTSNNSVYYSTGQVLGLTALDGSYLLDLQCDFLSDNRFKDLFTTSTPYLNGWDNSYYNNNTDSQYINNNSKMVLKLNNVSAYVNSIEHNFTSINNDFDSTVKIALSDLGSVFYEYHNTIGQQLISLNIILNNSAYCVYAHNPYDSVYELLGCTDAIYETETLQLLGVNLLLHTNFIDNTFMLTLKDYTGKYYNVYSYVFFTPNINAEKVYFNFYNDTQTAYISELYINNISTSENFHTVTPSNVSANYYVDKCDYNITKTYTTCMNLKNFVSSDAFQNRQCFDINYVAGSNNIIFGGEILGLLLGTTDLNNLSNSTKLLYSIIILIGTFLIIMAIGLYADSKSNDTISSKLTIFVASAVCIIEIAYLVSISWIPVYVIVLLLIISGGIIALFFKNIFVGDGAR